MAMYSADGNWYRAEIIDVEYASKPDELDMASIRFVDYGSFETVTRTRFVIRAMYSELDCECEMPLSFHFN